MSCALTGEGQSGQSSPGKTRRWWRHVILILAILGLCDLSYRVTSFAWREYHPKLLPMNVAARLVTQYNVSKNPYVFVILDGAGLAFLVGMRGDTPDREVVLGTGEYNRDTAEVRLDDVPRWSSCWDILSGSETRVQYDWGTSEPKGVRRSRNLEALGETKEYIEECAKNEAKGLSFEYPYDKALWLYGLKKGWFRPSEIIPVITLSPGNIADRWYYEIVFARPDRYISFRDPSRRVFVIPTGNINTRTFEIVEDEFPYANQE